MIILNKSGLSEFPCLIPVVTGTSLLEALSTRAYMVLFSSSITLIMFLSLTKHLNAGIIKITNILSTYASTLLHLNYV